MLCGEAWADFQGGSCCLRLLITWLLLLFSPTDSPARPSSLLPPRLLCQESFVRAKNWVKELQRQASPNIVIALAGNKADLANKRALDFQVGGSNTLKHLFEWRWASRTLDSLQFFSPPHPTPMNDFDPVSLCAFTGCTVVRRRQQLTFHGDVRQNLHERERDLHGHR